jgi:hypothetical protein
LGKQNDCVTLSFLPYVGTSNPILSFCLASYNGYTSIPSCNQTWCAGKSPHLLIFRVKPPFNSRISQPRLMTPDGHIYITKFKIYPRYHHCCTTYITIWYIHEFPHGLWNSPAVETLLLRQGHFLISWRDGQAPSWVRATQRWGAGDLNKWKHGSNQLYNVG